MNNLFLEETDDDEEEVCDFCGEPFSYSDGGDGEYEVSHSGCYQALRADV